MERDSLEWIITNDVKRVLGDRYDTERMLPSLRRKFDSMTEDGAPHPSKRCALVTKAKDLAEVLNRNGQEN